jgi:diguanylate cyclase (GGDEF)-like protein/PAS domain S-box-containing protein
LSPALLARIGEHPADSPLAVLARAGGLHWSGDGDPTGKLAEALASPTLQAEGLRCMALLPVQVDGEPLVCLSLGGRRALTVSDGTLEALRLLAAIFEQALLQLQAEERKRLAASVFDNAHEGIMITDAHGLIVEVNATFSELTGYRREEAVGQNADLLKSGHHDAAFYLTMWQTIREHGFWRGEVWNRKKSGEVFVELLTISAVRSPEGTITHYVGIFSDITLIKEHQSHLERLAHYDALTQLPNRMLLRDRMEQAMVQTERSGLTLAVCYLDLDGFKPVNDSYGHAAGDRLLIEVAQRLRQCVRGGDTVARLGGDEFVLLLLNLADVHEGDRAIGRVLSSLSSPFSVAGQSVSISASIGVTLFPRDLSDSDALLRHADQAMYSAKQAGRNQYCLFDPESDRRARTRRDEVMRMREGLNNEEFVLFYQPKVDMRQGRVVGAEALIRWQHPELGLLPPGEFLPAIEGSEFAIDLGNWVVQTALRQMQQWRDGGLEMMVSVNISGEHLQAPGFVEMLARQLGDHPDLPANSLELEVLETAALEDMDLMSRLFHACRALGVSFSLDDFGTGYSSLTYFRRLPAEILKIDQSFVRDMLDDADDLAIVEGVIGLTQAFKRKVIAEGVETIEHGMVLMQLGCDVVQGYGIARPMPAADVAAWVRDFAPDPLWNSMAGFAWSREDLPLLVAEVDHLRWIRQLFAHADDPDGPVGAPEHDCHQCRFGRWYDGAGERYGHLEAFRQIAEVHAEIHALGSRLLALPATVDPLTARKMREQIQAMSQQLAGYIQEVQASVLFATQVRRR